MGIFRTCSISHAWQTSAVSYVVVHGIPGTGKSTIAAPLAAELGLPLIAKDSIKESLWDALGPGDRAWSSKLGAAAMDVLWRLAAEAGSAVLESNFHPAFAHRFGALSGPLVEVHCTCDPELARARYANRRRHPCHFDLTYGLEMFDRWIAEAGPLGLGGPTFTVDTTESVDVHDLAGRIRRSL
jgi:predicted kinase